MVGFEALGLSFVHFTSTCLGEGEAFAFVIGKLRHRKIVMCPRSHRMLVVEKGID